MARRELKIIADDLGYSTETDAGIFEVFTQKGLLTGASLLVNGATSAAAAAKANELGLPLGLHLNFTEGCAVHACATHFTGSCEPFPVDPSETRLPWEWRERNTTHKVNLDDDPLLPEQQTASARSPAETEESNRVLRLLDKEGFWHANAEVMADEPGASSATRDPSAAPTPWEHALAVEATAQLCRFKELVGHDPAWFDGHNHCHVAPGVAAVLAPLFAKHGVLITRSPVEPLHNMPTTSLFLQEVSRAAREARSIYEASGIRSTQRFFGFRGATDNLKDVLSALWEMPMHPSDASCVVTAEWMVHPGRCCVSPEQGGCCGDGANAFACSVDRETEKALLESKELAQLIADDGWTLRPKHDIGFREEGAAPVPEAALPCSPPAKEGAPAFRVILLSSLALATGNMTTALRIRKMLCAAGCTVFMLDVDTTDGERLRTAVQEEGIDAVVGIHAFRAGPSHRHSWGFTQRGRVAGWRHGGSGRSIVELGDTHIASAIVLGGTDIHRDMRDEAKRAVMTKVLSRAAAIVAFNEPLRQGALDLLKPELHAAVLRIQQTVSVVPQGQRVPEDKRSSFSLRTALGLGPDDVIFLLPAGWRAVKDPLYLRATFEEWHAVDPRVRLVLVGPALEADGRAGWRRRAVAAAVQDAAHGSGAVLCHPFIPRNDLLSAMREATTVLNTSLSEGECNVLLEAMAVGVPVCARANAGNAALIRHEGNGLLFASPSEFLGLAKRLLAEPSLRTSLAASATQYLEQQHNTRQEQQSYCTLVDRLRSQRAAGGAACQ